MKKVQLILFKVCIKFFSFIQNNTGSSEGTKRLQSLSKKPTCIYQDEVHAVVFQFFFNFSFVCRMYKAEAGVICKKKSGIYKTIKTGVTIQFTQSGS